jgi:hypothetical protein
MCSRHIWLDNSTFVISSLCVIPLVYRIWLQHFYLVHSYHGNLRRKQRIKIREIVLYKGYKIAFIQFKLNHTGKKEPRKIKML